MKIFLFLTTLFIWVSDSSAESMLFQVHFLATRPDGNAQFIQIPFLGTAGSGGLRRWEAISKPFCPSGEDIPSAQDINLFSLSKINISSALPEQSPAQLSIDFSHLEVPKFSKCSKEDVIRAVFQSIIKTVIRSTEGSKPQVRVISSPEDQALVDREKAKYEQYDFGQPVREPTKTVEPAPTPEMTFTPEQTRELYQEISERKKTDAFHLEEIPAAYRSLENVTLVREGGAQSLVFRLINNSPSAISFSGSSAKKPSYEIQVEENGTWKALKQQTGPGVGFCSFDSGFRSSEVPPGKSIVFRVNDPEVAGNFRVGIHLYPTPIFSPFVSSE